MKTEDYIEKAVRESDYRAAFTYMQILLNERTIESNEKLIEVLRLVQNLEERFIKIIENMKDFENRIYELEEKDYDD